MAKVKRVVINEEECVGCESCVELCPDVFDFDADAEKASVKEDYSEDEACIQEAIDSCPSECIEWEED